MALTCCMAAATLGVSFGMVGEAWPEPAYEQQQAGVLCLGSGEGS